MSQMAVCIVTLLATKVPHDKMTVCIVTQFAAKVPHYTNDSMHSYAVPHDKNDSMHSYAAQPKLHMTKMTVCIRSLQPTFHMTKMTVCIVTQFAAKVPHDKNDYA